MCEYFSIWLMADVFAQPISGTGQEMEDGKHIPALPPDSQECGDMLFYLLSLGSCPRSRDGLREKNFLNIHEPTTHTTSQQSYQLPPQTAMHGLCPSCRGAGV